MAASAAGPGTPPPSPHHYDLSDDFYRLVLGDTMTSSCAVFADEDTGLDDAQRAK